MGYVSQAGQLLDKVAHDRAVLGDVRSRACDFSVATRRADTDIRALLASPTPSRRLAEEAHANTLTTYERYGAMLEAARAPLLLCQYPLSAQLSSAVGDGRNAPTFLTRGPDAALSNWEDFAAMGEPLDARSFDGARTRIVKQHAGLLRAHESVFQTLDTYGRSLDANEHRADLLARVGPDLDALDARDADPVADPMTVAEGRASYAESQVDALRMAHRDMQKAASKARGIHPFRREQTRASINQEFAAAFGRAQDAHSALRIRGYHAPGDLRLPDYLGTELTKIGEWGPLDKRTQGQLDWLASELSSLDTQRAASLDDARANVDATRLQTLTLHAEAAHDEALEAHRVELDQPQGADLVRVAAQDVRALPAALERLLPALDGTERPPDPAPIIDAARTVGRYHAIDPGRLREAAGVVAGELPDGWSAYLREIASHLRIDKANRFGGKPLDTWHTDTNGRILEAARQLSGDRGPLITTYAALGERMRRIDEAAASNAAGILEEGIPTPTDFGASLGQLRSLTATSMNAAQQLEARSAHEAIDDSIGNEDAGILPGDLARLHEDLPQILAHGQALADSEVGGLPELQTEMFHFNYQMREIWTQVAALHRLESAAAAVGGPPQWSTRGLLTDNNPYPLRGAAGGLAQGLGNLSNTIARLEHTYLQTDRVGGFRQDLAVRADKLTGNDS